MFNQTLSPVFTHAFFGRPYIGVARALLAITGLLRRLRAQQWFFLAVGAIGVLLSLGGPQLALVRRVPGFSQVNPFEYLWIVVLAGAVLAGYGVDRVISGDRRLLSRALALLVLLVAATVIDAGLQRPELFAHLGRGLLDLPAMRASEVSANATAAGSLLRFVLLAGLTGAVLLILRRDRSRRGIAAVLVGLTVLDLGLIDRGYWPMPAQSQVAPAATPSLRRVQQSGPQWRVVGLGGAFTPDLAERYGVSDARAVDLPLLTRYSRLFTTLGGVIVPAFGQSVIENLGASQLKLLDLLSGPNDHQRRSATSTTGGNRDGRQSPG